nr:endonuclease/exonuclease/phosphatase family protein [Maricaulis parjimensis]
MWIANIAPHRTLARLSEINPDIMALQEANANSALTGQALADQYAYAARCRSNRLLSRFEILDSGCLKAPEPADWATAIPCEWEIPPGVWARVRLPNGREAVFISTHLTWPVPGDTQACQRNGLAGALEEWSDEPVVLMGDFNAAAPSRSLARMDAAFGLERRTIGLATYPAYSRFEAAGWRPAPADPMLIGIDHVYASDHWASVHVTTGPDTGSDHRPVIATLRLLDTD